MKTIIQFLKSPYDFFSEDFEKIDSTKKDIEDLRSLSMNRPKTSNLTRQLKFQPKIQRNQIWTVKNDYDDFQGITQKASHPFVVLINNEPDDFEGESLVRVSEISPFIEMATVNDEVCDDPSIIGFPFIIESWNDQPILAELLDEYIGDYEVKSSSLFKSEDSDLVRDPLAEYFKANSETLSEIQQEFREIEISRSKYLNHSILSLLSFLENKQSKDSGVVISILDKIEYPKFIIKNDEEKNHLAAEPTAKFGSGTIGNNLLLSSSGLDGEDKYLLLDNECLTFKIYIRKNENGFIISIESTENIELTSNIRGVIDGTSNKEKTVFANLKPGNYILKTKTVKSPIKIRLK